MLPVSPQVTESTKVMALVIATITVMYWRKLLKALILISATVLIALVAYGAFGLLQTVQSKIG